jgi:ABC-type oligopeptide transport system ATPase subunit
MSGKSKSEKFIELANKRVNKTIKDLRLVANLANKKNYEFSEGQAAKIIKALQKEVDSVKHAFMDAKDETRDDFKL